MHSANGPCKCARIDLNNTVQLVSNLHTGTLGGNWAEIICKPELAILPHSYLTITSNGGHNTGHTQQNLIIHAANLDQGGVY